jgi:predicted SAM-dependent methyltransferase
MAWLRLTRPSTDRRFAAASGLLVNVGCGRHGKAGWVNVDSVAGPGVTCVYDCRKRIPLTSGTAKAVFTEHLLEHLEYGEEAPIFLAECHRIMEPGAVIRIVVPDGRKYIRAYHGDDWDYLRAFSPLAAGRHPEDTTLMEIVNEHFRQAGQHRFSYDYETLARLLRRSGFDAIVESEFGVSRMREIAIDSPDRATESLYVEAVRP